MEGSPERKRSSSLSSLSSLVAIRVSDNDILASAGSLQTAARETFDSSEFDVEHRLADDGNVCGVYIVRHTQSGKRFVFKPEDEEGFTLTELEVASTSSSVIASSTSSVSTSTTTSNEVSSSSSSSSTTLISSQFDESSGSNMTFTTEQETAISSSSSSLSLTVRKSNSQVAKVALRNGVAFGHTARKEIAAYRLDHENFSGVPRTISARLPVPENVPKRNIKHTKQLTSLGSSSELMSIDGVRRNGEEEEVVVSMSEALRLPDAVVKVGSLQEFQDHLCSAEDMGSSVFSNHQVQKIGILDLRLFNLDRHLGNLLVIKNRDQLDLVPIDHGYILPDIRDLSDANFEWMYWKQCKEPFTRSALSYIKRLNPRKDALILRSLDIPEPSILTCVTCTLLLQRAALRGLNLYQIAGMMQRSGLRDKPSTLEILVKNALSKVEAMCVEEGTTLDEFIYPSHHGENIKESDEQHNTSEARGSPIHRSSDKDSPNSSKSGSKTPPNRRSRASSMHSSPSTHRSPNSMKPEAMSLSDMKIVLEDLPFLVDPTASVPQRETKDEEEDEEDDAHVGSLDLDDLLELSGASEFEKLRQEMKTTKDGLPSVDSLLDFRIDSDENSRSVSREPSPPAHQSTLFDLDDVPNETSERGDSPGFDRTNSATVGPRLLQRARVSDRSRVKARRWQRLLMKYFDFLYEGMDKAIAEVDAPSKMVVPPSPLIRVFETSSSPEIGSPAVSRGNGRAAPPAFVLNEQ